MPLVVGASGLDVSRLLALVADLLATGRLLRAVTREVTVLATVVAFAAVNALACNRELGWNNIHGGGERLTRHVAVATAGVAGLATASGTTAVAVATLVAATVAAAASTEAIGAVAGNVADLAALE